MASAYKDSMSLSGSKSLRSFSLRVRYEPSTGHSTFVLAVNTPLLRGSRPPSRNIAVSPSSCCDGAGPPEAPCDCSLFLCCSPTCDVGSYEWTPGTTLCLVAGLIHTWFSGSSLPSHRAGKLSVVCE